jgi:tRNA nucleotidyltransferase (CCA-adding enzyme)
VSPLTEDANSDLAARVGALGLEPIAQAAGETPVYLVGGAVRDLLLGREPRPPDVAVEGEAIALARRIPGGEVREHARFGTATVRFDGREVDLARTRAETYERPGALPDVRPAGLDEDLGRRDFTVNAIAVPLDSPGEVIDPLGGRADLDAGLLRILHPRSFEDDPTRALRAARYAARLGFGLEPETERALLAADPSTVSADRIEAELLRLLAEEEWRRGFELLSEWGLAEGGDLELVGAVLAAAGPPTALLAGAPTVGSYAPPPEPLREGRELAATPEGPPSALAAAARSASPEARAIAWALGAGWLDDYEREWRDARLEIGGEDLMAAGVPEGPAVGRGLSAALAAKLDGQVRGREQELEVALAAAREG